MSSIGNAAKANEDEISIRVPPSGAYQLPWILIAAALGRPLIGIVIDSRPAKKIPNRPSRMK